MSDLNITLPMRPKGVMASTVSYVSLLCLGYHLVCEA